MKLEYNHTLGLYSCIVFTYLSLNRQHNQFMSSIRGRIISKLISPLQDKDNNQFWLKHNCDTYLSQITHEAQTQISVHPAMWTCTGAGDALLDLAMVNWYTWTLQQNVPCCSETPRDIRSSSAHNTRL